MDEIGVTLKNVIFRKIKSSQLVIYSQPECSEAATKYVPSNPSLTLPENGNIVEQEDINKASKIDQTLKTHKLERKCNQNGDSYINFFKTANDNDSFHVQWYGSKNEIICGPVETSESEYQCAKF